MTRACVQWKKKQNLARWALELRGWEHVDLKTCFFFHAKFASSRSNGISILWVLQTFEPPWPRPIGSGRVVNPVMFLLA